MFWYCFTFPNSYNKAKSKTKAVTGRGVAGRTAEVLNNSVTPTHTTVSSLSLAALSQDKRLYFKTQQILSFCTNKTPQESLFKIFFFSLMH